MTYMVDQNTQVRFPAMLLRSGDTLLRLQIRGAQIRDAGVSIGIDLSLRLVWYRSLWYGMPLDGSKPVAWRQERLKAHK